MSVQPLVQLSGISKSYPGVQALRDVDFAIYPGEIHCLVGENGAGKSTLMRVLAGATAPDEGTISVHGQKFRRLDPASGIAFGIGMIYQELDLVPAMSVAENIFLGHEPVNRGGILMWRQLLRRAGAILADFDVGISPHSLVRTLSPAERQLVQIAKTLSHENDVLVLDEPTAALMDNEVENLFTLLRRLRQRGLGIVYISHRLEEVLEIGDSVTVMRDGRRIVTRKVGGMTRQELIEAMVGRPLTESVVRSQVQFGTEGLAVEGLTRAGEFEDVSFTVRRGEVLGLAGLMGAGRSEMLETVFGVRRPDRGRISVAGKWVKIGSPKAAIRLGIGLVPEERRESGIVLSLSVADNLTMAVLDRLSTWFGLDRRRVGNLARTQIADLNIKTPNAQVPVGQLSGGNQQKVVIGKWLAADIRVLLLDEPTRGVDVNAKAEIYRLISDLARSGVAVVVASSDLPEILSITHRILVLSGGHPTAMLETSKTSQVEIMRYAIAAPAASRHVA